MGTHHHERGSSLIVLVIGLLIVGLVAWLFSLPLLLTSGWSIAPAALAAALLVVRTALEDRTLARKLPGYLEYSANVRFRLIPGIW